MSGKSTVKKGRPKRWSAKRKTEVVLRLLRGETLDALSRETGQPASRLAEWRDAFLEAGQSSLKSSAGSVVDDDPFEQERRRLQAKVGEITMDNELLQEKIRRMEAGLPLARRRSRK